MFLLYFLIILLPFSISHAMEKNENAPDLKLSFPNIHEELSFLTKEEKVSLIDITANKKTVLSERYHPYKDRIEYCYFYYWLLHTLVSKDNNYYYNTCTDGCFFFDGKTELGFMQKEKQVKDQNGLQYCIQNYHFFGGKYLSICCRDDNSKSQTIYITNFEKR